MRDDLLPSHLSILCKRIYVVRDTREAEVTVLIDVGNTTAYDPAVINDIANSGAARNFACNP